MPQKPHDLRRYARQTNYRLLVGGGLIYWFYGPSALVSGLVCMTTAITPLLIIYIFLAAMGWLAKKANDE